MNGLFVSASSLLPNMHCLVDSMGTSVVIPTEWCLKESNSFNINEDMANTINFKDKF